MSELLSEFCSECGLLTELTTTENSESLAR